MPTPPVAVTRLTKGQIDYACRWWSALLPDKYDETSRAKYRERLSVWLSGNLESATGTWPVPGHISTYLVTTDSPMFQCAYNSGVDVRDLPVSHSMLFLINGNIDIACPESPKLWVTVKIDNDTYQESGVSE
jgi:hypothetical protein